MFAEKREVINFRTASPSENQLPNPNGGVISTTGRNLVEGTDTNCHFCLFEFFLIGIRNEEFILI